MVKKFFRENDLFDFTSFFWPGLFLIFRPAVILILILGGPYTMFAPTDEAIDRIPRETLNKIIGDPTILKPILQRHIIPNKVF